jgi:hypothetical protein
MAIELGALTLDTITYVSVRERARLVRHAVPGLAGDLTQAAGRPSVEVEIRGVFLGEAAADRLQQLRDIHLDHSPVDFLAEAIGQAYFSQVLVSQLEVTQRAGAIGEFEYACTLLEYVEPPEPAAVDLAGALDAGILEEAAGFVDDVQNAAEQVSSLVETLAAAPSFANPTEGLRDMPSQYQSLITGTGTASLRTLRDLF